MNVPDAVRFLFVNLCDDRFPRITLMFEYLLSISTCSVDCDRGFSCINLCKSDLRNRMSVEHTSHLITIKLNGPYFHEFDFKACFS